MKQHIPQIASFVRLFVGVFAIILVCILIADATGSTQESVLAYEAEGSVLGANTTQTTGNVVVSTYLGGTYELPYPTDQDFIEAEEKYAEKLRKLEEEKKRIEEQKRIERENKIASISGYLTRYKSPMAPYAALIYDSCIPYGSHYCKFFLSIAGVESGFGRVCPPHNAWGWGGARYPSWEYSIPLVSNAIATKYYLKGYNTFEKLAYSSYGPKNPEAWIVNLYSFYNKMPAL